MQHVPELQAALELAIACLAEGASTPGGPWATPTLLTGGPAGAALRTVVLRRFSAAERWLEFHTDARSPKMAALLADPAVALHVWDPGRRVQVRLRGMATMLGAAEAAAIWQGLPAVTRDIYAVALAPGTPVASPGMAAHRPDEAAALAIFRVVRVGIEELEWLHLAPEQHRRARFTWANGVSEATWLAP